MHNQKLNWVHFLPKNLNCFEQIITKMKAEININGTNILLRRLNSLSRFLHKLLIIMIISM